MKSKRLNILAVAAACLALMICVRQSAAMPAEFHGKEVVRKTVEFFRSNDRFWSTRVPDDDRESKEVWLVLNPLDYNRQNDCLEGPSKDNGKLPAIIAGAIDEDGLVLDSSEGAFEYSCDLGIFLHHAWNPNTNRGWNIKGQSPVMIDTGLEWANYYFYWALKEYWEGKKARAYYLLGRVAHLLGDAATPAHAHGDPHLPDLGFLAPLLGDSADQLPIDPDVYEYSLEILKCERFCRSLSDCGEHLDYTQIRSFDDLDAKYPDISRELERNADNYFAFKSPVPLAELLWERGPTIQQKWPFNRQEQVDPDLFHIFYYAAERADDFPSEDFPGENSNMRLDDAEIYIKIGEEMMPVAVQSTVALLELFWDRTHSARISTRGPVIPLQPSEQYKVYLDIQNVGLVPWKAGEYLLENVNGHPLGAKPRQLLEVTVPRGHSARWALPITAPSSPGLYHSEWQMKKEEIPYSSIIAFDVVVLPEGKINIDLGALLEEWFNELKEQISTKLNAFWESLKQKFEEWLQRELERLWREFWESLFRQCCGANVVAPAVLLLGACGINRKRRGRIKDGDRD